MATGRTVGCVSGTDVVLSDGPNTDAQNHGRSHGSISEDLRRSSFYYSRSSDHLSHCSSVTAAVRTLSAKL